MGDVRDAIEATAPRLAEALAARGAHLELDLRAQSSAEAHLIGPLATLLLSAARHADPPRPFRVRATDRAGGDTEVVIDGVRLPDDFPESSPDADLWAVASGFLREFHRARLGRSTDRILVLVPGRERARRLRSREDPPTR